MRFPIFTSLVHILFPLRCKGCNTPGSALCSSCIARIPFATDVPDKTYAVFDYGNPLVRNAIRELKYHRHSEAARALTEAAIPYLIEHMSDQLQSFATQRLVLIPIPAYKERANTRGFNQSTLIASWLQTGLSDSHITLDLKKRSATPSQAKLNRKARLRNVVDTMVCTTTLDPKNIYVIIDDVITTGATCAEARRALRAAGARTIYAIALAHGYART